MRYFSPLLLVLWVFGLAARAQSVAYGDWQLHLPATHPQVLADAGDRLYVADESSFYFVDKTLNTTQRLSRRDGLSDVGVRAVAYDSLHSQVVMAYQNGNLDVLRANGTVQNITDVLRKPIQTPKNIDQIQVYNGVAYLASNLGLIVLDLTRFEVRDTYSAIGPGGQTVAVYGTAVVHDTIFASTSAGVLRGRISTAVNLLDYRSWTKETPNASVPADNFSQLLAYRGHVYAQATFRGVYCLSGLGAARGWRYLNGSYGDEAVRLHPSATGLLFSFLNSDLRSLTPPAGTVRTVLPQASIGANVRDMVREADGTLYVASYDRGLLRFGPGTTTNPELIRPNAPATRLAYGLLADAATSTVDVFSGGYNADSGLQFDQVEGFYEYQGSQWTSYNKANFPSLTDFPNLRDISHGTRTADGTLYVASYANGLLQWQGPGKFKQFTAGPGVPLRSTLSPDLSNLDYVRVTDAAADPNGRYLWVVNRHERAGVPGLLRYRPDAGSWQPAQYFTASQNLDRVVVDNFGNPWATQSRKGGAGLAVYDTTSRQALSFGTGTTNNQVYAIARDRTGSIWLGTGDGVSFFSDPSQVISYFGGNIASAGVFITPFAPNSDGLLFPTLYNTTVRCIAVDGANRKWFGTPSGLWLFSANADKALLHFTTANSPLPSNSIVDVAVNDKTGEVFVATDGGVVSYQGSASITDAAPSCAEVFPNPVRPEFAGQVGIRGLVNNAYVKITDVAGHLVYSTRAAGGTVTWDLNDAQGRRVRSGMYLVLTSDADGKNSCVSKVAVLSN
ncbi:MAG: hypothetical protein EOO36_00775 [Cytophagaceae bacterium]|nr:MAG: hypothetical protein EOO36_00775 [Cytophagaceae bacterium]